MNFHQTGKLLSVATLKEFANTQQYETLVGLERKESTALQTSSQTCVAKSIDK